MDDTLDLTVEMLQAAFVAAAMIPPDLQIECTGLRREPDGWAAWIRLPARDWIDATFGPLDAIGRSHQLAVALGVDPHRLILERDDTPYRPGLRVWLADTDPFAEPTRSPRLDRPVDVQDGVPFGVDHRHRPVRLPVTGSAVLIGGAPGTGKTNAAALLAATLTKPRVTVASARNGDEPGTWKVIGPHTATWLPAFDWLDVVHRETATRYRQLDENPTVPPASLVLVCLDDADRYLAQNPNAVDKLAIVVAMGPAVGITAVLTATRPRRLPWAILRATGTRLALRCEHAADSEVLLGFGSPLDATALPDQSGVGWLTHDHNRNPGRLIRTHLLAPEPALARPTP